MLRFNCGPPPVVDARDAPAVASMSSETVEGAVEAVLDSVIAAAVSSAAGGDEVAAPAAAAEELAGAGAAEAPGAPPDVCDAEVAVLEGEAPARASEARAPTPAPAAALLDDEIWVEDGCAVPEVVVEAPPDEVEASSPRSSFSGALSPARSAYGGDNDADGDDDDDDSEAFERGGLDYEDEDEALGGESDSDGDYDEADLGRFGFSGPSYEVVLQEPRLGMTLENGAGKGRDIGQLQRLLSRSFSTRFG